MLPLPVCNSFTSCHVLFAQQRMQATVPYLRTRGGGGGLISMIEMLGGGDARPTNPSTHIVNEGPNWKLEIEGQFYVHSFFWPLTPPLGRRYLPLSNGLIIPRPVCPFRERRHNDAPRSNGASPSAAARRDLFSERPRFGSCGPLSRMNCSRASPSFEECRSLEARGPGGFTAWGPSPSVSPKQLLGVRWLWPSSSSLEADGCVLVLLGLRVCGPWSRDGYSGPHYRNSADQFDGPHDIF